MSNVVPGDVLRLDVFRFAFYELHHGVLHMTDDNMASHGALALVIGTMRTQTLIVACCGMLGMIPCTYYERDHAWWIKVT